MFAIIDLMAYSTFVTSHSGCHQHNQQNYPKDYDSMTFPFRPMRNTQRCRDRYEPYMQKVLQDAQMAPNLESLRDFVGQSASKLVQPVAPKKFPGESSQSQPESLETLSILWLTRHCMVVSV